MTRNKKGFVTVWICLFFVSLTVLIYAFISAAKESAVKTGTDALCSLWAQSILAEYDLNLQQRYHLFGFYGYPADVTEKLDFYVGESFAEKSYINYEGSTCRLYAYALVNVDVFRRQIVEAGKLVSAEKLSEGGVEIQPVLTHEHGNVQTLFDELPSAGSSNGFSIRGILSMLQDEKGITAYLKKGSDLYFELEYIFSHFKHKLLEVDYGSSYFDQEIEYLLCGKKEDEGNQKSMRNKIIAVREGLNMVYLNQDPMKRNEALATAEILTPGPAAVATQQALLALWAFAESVNDYQLLVSGHHVPLIKTNETWAVDLESAMANQEDECIFTGIEEGQDYKSYLRFFLIAQDERVRALRMMDLLQINMRWLYYEDFLLREYNGGVWFSMTVNGEKHEVEKCYYPEK